MADTIRLGLMPPLTGLVEIYGAEIVLAARIACAEINDQGGVLGRQLEILIEDDGSLPSTAVPAANRLVDAGCVAIIGNLLSNSRIAVADQVAEPRHIPFLNFSFYEGSIAARHFFHFAALPNQQIERMIPWMAKEHGPKMFFAGNNYEWPRGSIDAAKHVLRAHGGEVVGEEYLSIGATATEIEKLLQLVSHSGADVFVPYFAGTDQIALLTRFTELGLKQRMAVVMGHYDEVMVSKLPPHVREGFYSSNTYFMSVDTPENHAFLTQLARQPEIFGIWPTGNGILSNFGEGTYLCVKAFAAAANIAMSVESLELVSVTGPQGRVTMDAMTHHAHVNTYLARCRADGWFNIIEKFGCIAPEIPLRYRKVNDLYYKFNLSQNIKPSPSESPASLRINTIRHILNVTDAAVIACDIEGIIIEANNRAYELFGYPINELNGIYVQLLLPPHLRSVHAQHISSFINSTETFKRMKDRSEVIGYRKDGTFFPVEASIAKIIDDNSYLLVVTLQDITERKRFEEVLMWKATHDSLTSLPNRTLIRDRLISALKRSRRTIDSVGLLFIDLDGFKLINDSYGHEAGDELLKIVANRFIENARPGDIIARIAGDEFVILCEQVEQPVMLAKLAEHINDALHQPITIKGNTLAIAASIGVTVGHGSTHGPDDLLRNAETAMYAVKSHGRDGWQFFSDQLEQEMRQRIMIINNLRVALDHNEFKARYQPIVAVEGRRVVGAEILLRWYPPSGEISPGIFVPVAESTGAIVPIGAWVFRQACITVADWRARFANDTPYLSVNVSTRQLDAPNLFEHFSHIIQETGADPHDLLIEITETSLMSNIESNLRTLHQLAELGLRIAVDDFGTGYSSFAQLLRLPLSVVKIDRSFINGIDVKRDVRIVAAAIINMAKTLGHRLVAEGVETEAQLAELRSLGCDYAQGYLFNRPLEANKILEAIHAGRQSVFHGDQCDQSIFYMLYVSEAIQPFDSNTLEELMKKSRENNRINGITGCLIYQNNSFMQIIEGNYHLVKILFDKINRDSRHDKITVILQGNTQRRVFPNWSMKFYNVNLLNERIELTKQRKRAISLLELAEDPVACYAYITAFARNN